MNQVIPSAATGSAHHQPKSAFNPMPASVMSDNQKQAVGLEGVGLERPAAERSRRPTLRPREPDHGHEGQRREADTEAPAKPPREARPARAAGALPTVVPAGGEGQDEQLPAKRPSRRRKLVDRHWV